MNMQCNTCHQGNDPREEAPMPADADDTSFTLRKVVNPDICLKCHGQFNNEVMGLPQPWPGIRDAFQNNCLGCHMAIRTTRHQVNYLHADAIEKAGEESGDSCYGCHGGRAWYQLSYPYPRHAWPGMSPDVPDWAKDRPTESEPRFHLNTPEASAQTGESPPLGSAAKAQQEEESGKRLFLRYRTHSNEPEPDGS
jgi:hypothetical protein